MLALLAAWLAGAGAADASEVAALERTWSGVRDSSEQVVLSLDRGAALWREATEQRVRTIVAPVSVGWLGAHVLYLEEFIEDDPQQPRRQLLLQLESVAGEARAVRAHLYGFVNPARWTHLNYRPQLVALLTREDIEPAAGCDLVL